MLSQNEIFFYFLCLPIEQNAYLHLTQYKSKDMKIKTKISFCLNNIFRVWSKGWVGRQQPFLNIFLFYALEILSCIV